MFISKILGVFMLVIWPMLAHLSKEKFTPRLVFQLFGGHLLSWLRNESQSYQVTTSLSLVTKIWSFIRAALMILQLI